MTIQNIRHRSTNFW